MCSMCDEDYYSSYWDMFSSPKEKTPTRKDPMKKFWTVSGHSDKQFDTKDEAIVYGKKRMESRRTSEDMFVLEATDVIKFPIPAYEVVAIPATA